MHLRENLRTLGPMTILVCAALAFMPGCVSKSKYTKSQEDLQNCTGQLQQQKQSAAVSDSFYHGLVGAMKDEISANQLTIQQMKNGVSVNLPAAVLFRSGSPDINRQGRAIIKKVAEELKDVPYQTIVAGFADNVPIGGQLAKLYPSNWDLAAARSAEVACLLQENGIPQERLLVISYGENDPVASNDTAEGRAQNRRIEIRLRPVAVYQ